MIEPYRQCSVDGCTDDAPKVRGYGMGRHRLCVHHYSLEVARPGEVVAAPVVAPVPVVAPEPAVVAVVAPQRLQAPPPPSERVLLARKEADTLYRALLGWMPRRQLVTGTEVAEGLGCSMSQARIALRRGAREGKLRSWPSRGYGVAGWDPPPSMAALVLAHLKEHGESPVSAVVAATGLTCEQVSTAAKSSPLIMSVGRGIIKAREP